MTPAEYISQGSIQVGDAVRIENIENVPHRFEGYNGTVSASWQRKGELTPYCRVVVVALRAGGAVEHHEVVVPSTNLKLLSIEPLRFTVHLVEAPTMSAPTFRVGETVKVVGAPPRYRQLLGARGVVNQVREPHVEVRFQIGAHPMDATLHPEDLVFCEPMHAGTPLSEVFAVAHGAPASPEATPPEVDSGEPPAPVPPPPPAKKRNVRQWTDEQRQAASNRMKQAHADGSLQPGKRGKNKRPPTEVVEAKGDPRPVSVPTLDRSPLTLGDLATVTGGVHRDSATGARLTLGTRVTLAQDRMRGMEKMFRAQEIENPERGPADGGGWWVFEKDLRRVKPND